MGGRRRIGWRAWLAALPLAVSLLPSPALADHGQASVDLVLKGSIAPRCDFSNAPSELTIAPAIDPAASRPFGFACNFPGVSMVNLTIASTNGALLRDDAAQRLAYSIDWRVDGAAVVDGFVPGAQASAFPFDAGPAGSARTGSLTVRLRQPDMMIEAGHYSDQIVFTLSP